MSRSNSIHFIPQGNKYQSIFYRKIKNKEYLFPIVINGIQYSVCIELFSEITANVLSKKVFQKIVL